MIVAGRERERGGVGRVAQLTVPGIVCGSVHTTDEAASDPRGSAMRTEAPRAPSLSCSSHTILGPSVTHARAAVGRTSHWHRLRTEGPPSSVIPMAYKYMAR